MPRTARIRGCADVAQLVERVHGKDEVRGSSPRVGSRKLHSSYRNLARNRVYRLSGYVRVCPSDGCDETPLKEPKMALSLAIRHLPRPRMVRRGSGVRVPASALAKTPQLRLSRKVRDSSPGGLFY
jgi:hypothetical protein